VTLHDERAEDDEQAITMVATSASEAILFTRSLLGDT
jgi:hypothetical protein